MTKHDERLGLMIWFRLSRFYNESLRKSNQHLKAYNLTVAQFDVLVQTGAHEPLSQQQLADKLFVTKGNMTQLLKKLEDRGLILREQIWRTKTLSLTQAGVDLLNKTAAAQESFQASQFQGLAREEQKQLLELLRKLQKTNKHSGGI
ncbi:MarR family winged helix-turn-helix transcriptional regulator [Alteribacillus sp. HJP-4]|uniref:MarR family winged helix-turn-helix transcriptional regulator n=1 Tax=Alteribacillus sp. HJP-4 TaxID=2775394 RepID=UPI0035CCFFB7